MIGTRYQKGSLLKRNRKSVPDTWVFRWYEHAGGKRIYRTQTVGTVATLPLRRDAEKAVAALRVKINSEIRSPETVSDLIAHYLKHELTTERKAYSTVAVNSTFIRLYVAPTWGSVQLSMVKSVAVEEWLSALPLSPASRTKIKAVFSALFSHAIRHEWVYQNPIKAVRCSAKRLREKDVLTPVEFGALLEHLGVRERAMVMLVGSTGVRRSELIGFKWEDIDESTMEIALKRSCVRNRFGETKTQASRRPVPLHPLVLESLLLWKRTSDYLRDGDFLFPSLRLRGDKPLSPDTLLKKIIRPALQRAGIKGKVIGWHSFRHSLATNLRSLGVDVKVAQELLRHANSRTTMDIYTHAVSEQKHEATRKVVDLLVPQKTARTDLQHPSAPSAVSLLAVSC